MNLVKSILTYASVVALSISATLFITEKQSEQPTVFTSNSEVVVVSLKETIESNKKPYTINLNTNNLKQEFWCLKVLGWNEIREGNDSAMKAVYSVVENRKNSGLYPKTYCGVMKQTSQFSFWNKGKYSLSNIEPSPKNPMEAIALKKIEAISLKVVSGTFKPTLHSSVLWYSTPLARSNKGSNHWTQQYKVVTKVGPHLFYSKNEKINKVVKNDQNDRNKKNEYEV